MDLSFLVYLSVTVVCGLLVYALRRTRAANAALLLFTLVLCFTGLETYYRFIYAQSDGFARLGKNFAARYYRYDAYGLRASHLPLSETKPNLVVLGDSHVFGAGLKSTSDRFSEILAARYPQLHVANLGYPGWNTPEEIAALKKYVGSSAARIPLVVLAYFFNDIESDILPDDQQRIAPAHPAPKPGAADHLLQAVSRYSRFVEIFYFRIGYPRLVRDRLDQIQMFYRDPAILKRHLDTVDRLRAEVEGRYHSRVVIVLLPFLHSNELLRKSEFYQHFDRSLAARSFEFIDMQPAFSRFDVTKLRVSHYDPHTNAFANRMVADALARYIDANPTLLGAP